jgi:hypothetical protein
MSRCRRASERGIRREGLAQRVAAWCVEHQVVQRAVPTLIWEDPLVVALVEPCQDRGGGGLG